jgi:hypothetical protein
VRAALEALWLWLVVGAVLAGGAAAGFGVFFILHSISR